MKFPVKSLGEDGKSILLEAVDLGALGASGDLPYQIERYFVLCPGAFLVPLTALITTRRRPRGTANAASLMRAAYDGHHARRAPVRVRPHGPNDYLVEDGNSTVLNAIASAWPDILCVSSSSSGEPC
jgi:hypothetical protein